MDHGCGIHPCTLTQWVRNGQRGCEAWPQMIADGCSASMGKKVEEGERWGMIGGAHLSFGAKKTMATTCHGAGMDVHRGSWAARGWLGHSGLCGRRHWRWATRVKLAGEELARAGSPAAARLLSLFHFPPFLIPFLFSISHSMLYLGFLCMYTCVAKHVHILMGSTRSHLGY